MDETALFFKAFLFSLSLIFPIGVQNLYVLRQGVLGKHVLLTATVFSLGDAFLIVVGGVGAGMMIEEAPEVKRWLVAGGALFLLYYGLRCYRRAFRGGLIPEGVAPPPASWQRTLLTALGFSLLNPQGVFETTVLIGGVAAGLESGSERAIFLSGACLASVAWFFSLAYGARYLKPLLQKRRWQIGIDLFIGTAMLFIAWKLFQHEVPSYMR
ncbi:LysE/ArgO family amino acid transporter [Estrella lausannensis]|uniref:Putative lysine exporter protein n=1 Tax=Estrella lausannensis TaxID=483423 RepID=A0A0H5DRB2_9BACT|nr:LysE family transporter [Estrella lausannensis]CRX39112.1 Putative lysine exporter protein [Estrella lausannensis]